VEPRPRLLLFARAPRLGRVKTRLEPVLGDDGCLLLYRAFLEDASRQYRSPDWESDLLAEPDASHPALAEIFPPPWTLAAQSGGDLGERLGAAFTDAFHRGAPVAVAVGSDHPLLDSQRVSAALEAAARQRAAIVPAQDGGYCAIALSAGVRPVDAFQGIPWSTPGVLGATLAALARAGVMPELMPPSTDVDRPEDLVLLRREIASLDPDAPGYPAATARALAQLPIELLA
jgi:rSAM/selenodomain-associated transferase 1